MNKLIALTLIGLFLFSCNKKSSEQISIEQLSLQKNFGNCTAKDGGCLKVSIGYPKIHDGSEALRNTVNGTINKFIIDNLVMGESDEDSSIEKLDTALIELEEEFRDFLDDMDFASSDWAIETMVEVTYSDSSYLGLSMSNFSYTGGAHPNTFVSLKIFDKTTGNELQLDDVVKNTNSVKILAEKNFRKQYEILPKGSLNEQGFWFEGDKFVLPTNIGISNDGLEFYYNPYEIAPYSMGPSNILLPFSEIKNLMK